MAHDVKNILIAEDSQDIRDLIAHVLSADGFHMYTAIDGEGALTVLNNNLIDLVLLDVMMPGISGFEVLKEIRGGSNRKIRDVLVMMITAKSSADDIDKALSLGANSYLVKPFRSATIRDRVNSLLHTNPSSDKQSE